MYSNQNIMRIKKNKNVPSKPTSIFPDEDLNFDEDIIEDDNSFFEPFIDYSDELLNMRYSIMIMT